MNDRSITSHRWKWACFAATGLFCLLGLAYRLRLLHEPVRNDEVYSLLHFAVQPLAFLRADYSSTNNHFLYTIAMHLAYGWFGLSDLSLRLPALIAGVITIGLMAWLAWDVSRSVAATGLTSLVGSFSYGLLYYSVNGRGYSIQMVFALTIAIILRHAAIWRSPVIPIALLSAALAALLYTVPSGLIFVLPLFVSGVVVALRHRRGLWAAYALLPFVLCALLLLIAFGPALPMMMAIHSNSGDDPWRVLGSVARLLSDGVLPFPACAVAIALGLWSILRRDRDTGIVAGFIVLGYPALLVFGRIFPVPALYDRCYALLFPFAYIVMSIGIVTAVQTLAKRSPRWGVVFGVGIGLWIVTEVGYAASAVVQDPSRLYFPERPIMAAGRDLIPPLARSLEKGQTIAGAGLPCDTAAEYYTIQTRGFHGFYSLFDPVRRHLWGVYLLTDNPAAAQTTWKDLSSQSPWTAPKKIAESGPVSIYYIEKTAAQKS